MAHKTTIWDIKCQVCAQEQDLLPFLASPAMMCSAQPRALQRETADADRQHPRGLKPLLAFPLPISQCNENQCIAGKNSYSMHTQGHANTHTVPTNIHSVYISLLWCHDIQ